MTDAEFNEYATALAESDVDTKALLYMKRWKSLMKVDEVSLLIYMYCDLSLSVMIFIHLSLAYKE